MTAEQLGLHEIRIAAIFIIMRYRLTLSSGRGCFSHGTVYTRLKIDKPTRWNSILQHRKAAGRLIEMQKLMKRIQLLADRAELVPPSGKSIKRSGHVLTTASSRLLPIATKDGERNFFRANMN